MKRRHAITLLAAAALPSCRRRDPLLTFSSIVFGTEVDFQTHGITQASFDDISEKCSLRLRVIESLFSLYDSDSAIRRLNRDGRLENPHPEFLKLIRRALDFGKDTGGLFDITVQPLWNWRQEWKDADFDQRETMQNSWKNALDLVDYRNVIIGEKVISFAKTGMAITLNGIAQGYATDEIISVFRRNGIRNALVNIGEYAAHGLAPDGNLWNVKLAATEESISLPPGRALAVSSGSGYTFDPEGRYHHIFRPADGENPRPMSSIVVTAPSAATADALSTAFTVANKAERQEILTKFPGADFREFKK